MKRFFNNVQEHMLLRALLFFLIGLVILVIPRQIFQFIVIITAGYIGMMGLLDVISGIRLKRSAGTYGISVFTGIVWIILAFIVWFFAPVLVSILPFFLGLLILIYSVLSFLRWLNSVDRSIGWLIYSIVIFIAGIVLVFNPFASTMILFQLFGALLIVMSISELLAYFRLKKMEQK